jgi:hypothetical protein
MSAELVTKKQRERTAENLLQLLDIHRATDVNLRFTILVLCYCVE